MDKIKTGVARSSVSLVEMPDEFEKTLIACLAEPESAAVAAINGSLLHVRTELINDISRLRQRALGFADVGEPAATAVLKQNAERNLSPSADHPYLEVEALVKWLDEFPNSPPHADSEIRKILDGAQNAETLAEALAKTAEVKPNQRPKFASMLGRLEADLNRLDLRHLKAPRPRLTWHKWGFIALVIGSYSAILAMAMHFAGSAESEMEVAAASAFLITVLFEYMLERLERRSEFVEMGIAGTEIFGAARYLWRVGGALWLQPKDQLLEYSDEKVRAARQHVARWAVLIPAFVLAFFGTFAAFSKGDDQKRVDQLSARLAPIGRLFEVEVGRVAAEMIQAGDFDPTKFHFRVDTLLTGSNQQVKKLICAPESSVPYPQRFCDPMGADLDELSTQDREEFKWAQHAVWAANARAEEIRRVHWGLFLAEASSKLTTQANNILTGGHLIELIQQTHDAVTRAQPGITFESLDPGEPNTVLEQAASITQVLTKIQASIGQADAVVGVPVPPAPSAGSPLLGRLRAHIKEISTFADSLADGPKPTVDANMGAAMHALMERRTRLESAIGTQASLDPYAAPGPTPPASTSVLSRVEATQGEMVASLAVLSRSLPLGTPLITISSQLDADIREIARIVTPAGGLPTPTSATTMATGSLGSDATEVRNALQAIGAELVGNKYAQPSMKELNQQIKVDLAAVRTTIVPTQTGSIVPTAKSSPDSLMGQAGIVRNQFQSIGRLFTGVDYTGTSLSEMANRIQANAGSLSGIIGAVPLPANAADGNSDNTACLVESGKEWKWCRSEVK